MQTIMETRAVSKFQRVTPQKARQVTRLIQGKFVTEALGNLELTPRKAARIVRKTLRSAMANAESQYDLDTNALVVKTAVVEEGPTMKRFRAKARGMVGPVNKRTSHIKIIVSDE